MTPELISQYPELFVRTLRACLISDAVRSIIPQNELQWYQGLKVAFDENLLFISPNEISLCSESDRHSDVAARRHEMSPNPPRTKLFSSVAMDTGQQLPPISKSFQLVLERVYKVGQFNIHYTLPTLRKVSLSTAEC
ncbi:hypothetical protein NPIL_218971 [Nephila pilipes]|uniref:Uncharacterized protein n=1 Tax=Nephila pilipes TaxID=299642 RepID=A0A8X6Q2H6_NEPPI|nr:hypothetical protein NPIL_218971 [Nephila pilipes]